MEQTLFVSNTLLWILVIVLAGVVFSLARQIGLLHQRIAPAGALMIGDGSLVGKQAPIFQLETLSGDTVRIGEPNEHERKQLIYFLSPTCPICASLIPVLQSLMSHDPNLEVILASDGEKGEHVAFVERKKPVLGGFPYVLSQELGVTFGVAKLPYAALINADGIVRAHGLVNSREHLESLLEAEALGIASIQEYMENSDIKQAAGQN